MFNFIVLSLILVFVVAYLWAEGIDWMQTNHPEYKGEDFLNFDGEDGKPN